MTDVEKFFVLFLNWLTAGLAIFITAYILPGVSLDGFTTALVLAIILAGINLIIKPIFIILTLPITVMTLGLFILVINALLVMLASWVIPGFEVRNFIWALVFGLVLSLVNAVFNALSSSSR